MQSQPLKVDAPPFFEISRNAYKAMGDGMYGCCDIELPTGRQTYLVKCFFVLFYSPCCCAVYYCRCDAISTISPTGLVWLVWFLFGLVWFGSPALMRKGAMNVNSRRTPYCCDAMG